VAKKAPVITPPSQQTIELVLNTAANAPLQNLQHAAQVDKALTEVTAFFRALLGPQASGGRSGGTPQASEIEAGKPSAQG
jgi:hypothetical protein